MLRIVLQKALCFLTIHQKIHFVVTFTKRKKYSYSDINCRAIWSSFTHGENIYAKKK